MIENRLKKGLGRGLSSLLGDSSKKIETNKVPIKDITRNRFQPRKNFNKENLEDLTNSIKEQGVIQPIVVRPSKQAEGKYEIIAGERRYRASKSIKLKEIPAYVIEVKNDSDMMQIALIENIQRENLNPMEESEAYALLQNQFKLSQNDIAKSVGKNRSTIANSLRLLQLPLEIRKSLKKIT